MRDKTRKDKIIYVRLLESKKTKYQRSFLPWCLALTFCPYSEVQPNWQLSLNLCFKRCDLHGGLELKEVFSSFFSKYFGGNGRKKYCSIRPTPYTLISSNLSLPTLLTDGRVAKDKNQKRNLGVMVPMAAWSLLHPLVHNFATQNVELAEKQCFKYSCCLWVMLRSSASFLVTSPGDENQILHGLIGTDHRDYISLSATTIFGFQSPFNNVYLFFGTVGSRSFPLFCFWQSALLTDFLRNWCLEQPSEDTILAKGSISFT